MSDKSLRARVALGEMRAMGLTLADLEAVSEGESASSSGPTVAEYVPVVAASYQRRSRRTYNSYWNLLVEWLGSLALGQVTVDDLQGVADEAARRAKTRRCGSDGRASTESCVAAMRAVFGRADRAGLVETDRALLVAKPRRLPNRRRALSQAELEDVWAAVTATTRDPGLDLFLLRFHLESGARRIGAINLRLRDLDRSRQTIWLREKFGSEREQPISAGLLDALADLATARGSTESDDPALGTSWRRKGELLPLDLRPDFRHHPGAGGLGRADPADRPCAAAHRDHRGGACCRVCGCSTLRRHAPSSVTGTYRLGRHWRGRGRGGTAHRGTSSTCDWLAVKE